MAAAALVRLDWKAAVGHVRGGLFLRGAVA
jgi:hypothetical protein